MSSELRALIGVDFSSWDEPDPELDRRDFLEAWLVYQRHEFIRKLRDLTPEQIVRWSVPPLELSVLGLVRHMTQMEHVYLAWGLGGGERKLRYGEDDFAGGSVESLDEDLGHYFSEVDVAKTVLGSMSGLEERGQGHGRKLEATLVKMIDEYALHAGQAHMLRFAALGEVLR